MIDITQPIKIAMGQQVLWAIHDFSEVIDILSIKGYKISFWDGEENWATINHNDLIVGYLWRKYAVLFITTEYLANVSTCLPDYPFIIIIPSQNLTEKVFRLDYNSEMQNILSYGPDYECFSAEDLWFYTNT